MTGAATAAPARARAVFASLAGLALLGTSIGLGAAEWAFQPGFGVTGEYNDNRRFTTGPHNAVIGSIINLRADASLTTETAGLIVTPLLRFTRYSGEDGLNSNDQFVDIRGYFNRERMRVSLDIDLTSDTSLTSELLTTGTVRQRKRRHRIVLAPKFELALTERGTLRVAGSHTDVTYVDPGRTGLVDSTYDLLQVTGSYQIKERTSAFASGYWSRFEVPDRFSVVDSVGAQLGVTHNFTETLSATAAGGLVHSESELSAPGFEIDRDTDGYLVDLDVTASFERTTFQAGYARTLTPTGNGFLVQRDQLNLDLRHDFSRQLTGFTNVLAFRNQSLGDRIRSQNRDVLRFRIGLSWQAARAWRFGASYRFAIRDDDLVTETAKSNAVFLSLSYTDDRHTLSR